MRVSCAPYFSQLFLSLLNGHRHRHHIRQSFLAPMLFVGLMFLGRLTSKPFEGLTILVPKMTRVRIVTLMGPAVSLALLAKLFNIHLLWDSNRRAPFRRTLVGHSLFRTGCSSLVLRPLFLAIALQHDALNILQVR